MRTFIDIVREAFQAHNTYTDSTVFIHKNPSRSSLAGLFRKFPEGLRGFIGPCGFWVWDANLLHDDALQQLQPGCDGFYLYLTPEMVQIKGEDYFEEYLSAIREIESPLVRAYGEEVPYAQDDGSYM